MPVKIIGSVHIGNNQRIMVMEAGEEWVVLGVTPQHIAILATMPRQEIENLNDVNAAKKVNLPAWLQNAVKRSQGKN